MEIVGYHLCIIDIMYIKKTHGQWYEWYEIQSIAWQFLQQYIVEHLEHVFALFEDSPTLQ